MIWPASPTDSPLSETQLNDALVTPYDELKLKSMRDERRKELDKVPIPTQFTLSRDDEDYLKKFLLSFQQIICTVAPSLKPF